MSTGLNCLYIEVDEKWYHILEQESAPKVCWSWYEHADCVGPFDTLDAAQEHLHRNNANPGGFCTRRGITMAELEAEADQKKDHTFVDLIKKAENPKQQGYFSNRGFVRYW